MISIQLKRYYYISYILEEADPDTCFYCNLHNFYHIIYHKNIIRLITADSKFLTLFSDFKSNKFVDLIQGSCLECQNVFEKITCTADLYALLNIKASKIACHFIGRKNKFFIYRSFCCKLNCSTKNLSRQLCCRSYIKRTNDVVG